MDSQSSPTAGPWRVPTDYSNFQVHGPDGIRVADVLTIYRHAAECEANARLIAAAPELLAVLKGILTQAGSSIDTEWLERASFAIAQAEGRTP